MNFDERIRGSVGHVSIARNSVARLGADLLHMGFAFLSGAITARWLEPEGKGAYAALTFLITIAAAASSLGLGDALVIMFGRGEATLRRIVSVCLIPVVSASIVGAALLVLIARAQIADQGQTLGSSIALSAAIVPFLAMSYTLAFAINARERIVLGSSIRAGVQAMTFLSIVVLVIVFPLHITGAVLATGVGVVTSLIAVIVVLRGMDATLEPSWDPQLLSRALRLGLSIELAHIALALASRLDVLLVYQLAGRSDAGVYSVSLTMAQLVPLASQAITFALFPRVTRLSDDESLALVARASRLGIATSLMSAGALLIAIPIITPLAFGRSYLGSIVPALVLLAGGVFWAQQHLLARARTARGRTRLQLAAAGSTLVTMIVLDVLLIPTWGIVGAALASTVAPIAGLTVCLVVYRAAPVPLRIADLIPHPKDFTAPLTLLRNLLRHPGGHRAPRG